MAGPIVDNEQIADKKANVRRIKLVDRVHFFTDYVIKVASEFIQDSNYFFQRLIMAVVARFFYLISRFFVSPFGKDRSLRNRILFGIPSVAAGLILLIGLCFVSLILVLIGGTFASLMGLRNFADYSLKEQISAWLTFFLLIAFAPFVMSEFWTYKITLIFCYMIVIIGLDFLYGQCGIVTVGHAGFIFWGSYMTAFLSTGSFGFKLNYILSLMLAATSSFFIGLLLGAPSLRVKDQYLFIITLAFTTALPQFMKSQYMAPYAGLSTGGLAVNQIDTPEFLQSWLSQTQWNYFWIVGFAFILIIFAYNLIHHSQVGRAFRTIKCDAEISTIMGIPVVRYKLLAFAISALYASIAGSLITYLNSFISPDSYTTHDSIDYSIASLIGGQASILGSCVGGIFLVLEKDLAEHVSHLIFGGQFLTRMMFGIFMILLIFVAPRGIVGEITKRFKSMITKRPKRGNYYLYPPADYDFLNMKSSTIKKD